jgi:hypothetical protein
MGITLFFQFSFVWYCFMNHKHEALWLLKNCKLYIICRLILSNFFHLTTASKLILIESELCVPKCCHANL